MAANDGVALAKVILITRDEHELIDDFVEYYGNVLFGMRNVVVIDNGNNRRTKLWYRTSFRSRVSPR